MGREEIQTRGSTRKSTVDEAVGGRPTIRGAKGSNLGIATVSNILGTTKSSTKTNGWILGNTGVAGVVVQVPTGTISCGVVFGGVGECFTRA